MTSTDVSSPLPGDRLSSIFLDVPDSAQASRWDVLWKNGNFLPWDKGHANPALIDLLSSSPPAISSEPNPSIGAPNMTTPQPLSFTLPTPSKKDGTKARVLIPGCGKGYDIALFAAHGYDAYGLEVSSHAAEVANKYLENTGEGPLEAEYHAAAQRSAESAAGKMICLHGDFFRDEWLAAIHDHIDSHDGFSGFDLIYDNTFLSALPPTLRPSWASRMTQLLSPNGMLVCLEFPTHKVASAAGPPWPLPSDVYLELLKRPGEEVLYDKSGVIIKTNGVQSDTALVRILHYTPKRTHRMGIIDRVVRDCVSIWQHTA